MQSADWIAAASLVVALVGLGLVICQLKYLNRQVRLQNFSDYTKRYQEIILNFPENINELDFKLPTNRKSRDPILRYMRAYFDLCFEEWYLHRNGLIDEKFWCVWKGGIETALSKPAFRQAWSIIKLDTKFGEDFECFIEHISND